MYETYVVEWRKFVRRVSGGGGTRELRIQGELACMESIVTVWVFMVTLGAVI